MANDYTYVTGSDCTATYGMDITGNAVIRGDLHVDGTIQGKEANMRALYRITVVNPKSGDISSPLLVVAKDREAALLKAALAPHVRENSDDYDILVEVVGDVRAKKDVQKVKIVEKGEE